MNYIKLNEIRHNGKNIWSERILAQLDYSDAVSKADAGAYDADLDAAVDFLYEFYRKNGPLTLEAVTQAENMLAALSKRCKEDTLLCAAHAHIDMNWQWGLEETVDITLSTFRTMLELMEQVPEFTFSQSQAAVYRFVEKYDPEMLEKIKRRIKEGRWEITASAWVETDKNMVNGEGLTRHILYTKEYLGKLFDLAPDYFDIDFEPDTFGHSANVPEILANCGVKYYYHCRGKVVPEIYRWKAKSGASVLSYREPFWYNAEISANEICGYPQLMKKYGLKKMLKVYGVGNHGGGATRRDLLRIFEYNSWPLMPNFKFSTYREFYRYIDQNAVNVETFEGELNYIFTGCYTSQSRIKAANRSGERFFYEAEKLNALSTCPYDMESIKRAWRCHLFNHFHDILPGSGVRQTREYALGKSQERNAVLGSVKTKALLDLASRINTDFIRFDAACTDTALGAGVGFYASKGVFAGNMSGGPERGYLVYNASPLDKSFFELSLWDYAYPCEQIRLYAGRGGEALSFEISDAEPVFYNGHSYRRLVVEAPVPADGYTCILVRPDGNAPIKTVYDNTWFLDSYWREHHPAQYILDNGIVRAEFSADNGNLIRFTNLKTGFELYDGGKSVANFKYIKEDSDRGMNSWVVGRCISSCDLISDNKILRSQYKNTGLKKTFGYQVSFKNSFVNVCISLCPNSDYLEFDTTVDFKEFGVAGDYTPALHFAVKSDDSKKYLYDNAYGVTLRHAENEDNVALSSVFNGDEQDGIILSSDSKHGFRCVKGRMDMNLIRGTTEPDKYPESYEHRFKIFLGFLSGKTNKRFLEKAADYNLNCDCVSLQRGTGTLLPQAKLFEYNGNAVLSAVKRAETGEETIFRFFEPEGKDEQCTLKLDGAVSAEMVDGCENKLCGLKVADGKTEFIVKAGSVCAVKIKK